MYTKIDVAVPEPLLENKIEENYHLTGSFNNRIRFEGFNDLG